MTLGGLLQEKRFAEQDLGLNRHIITHWFTVEDILADEAARAEMFDLLSVEQIYRRRNPSCPKAAPPR